MTLTIPSKQDVFFDPAIFAETFLKIQDKQKRTIPLVFNRAQRDFLSKRTGHDLILKARQLGFSTLIQAELFRAVTTSSATTVTLTHLDATTQAMRRMADRFYEALPEGFRPTRKYANSTITTYPDFDSESIIGTAGSSQGARGISATDAHFSEFAFYKDPESILAGAMQSGNPRVIIESTPNGAKGLYYSLCMDALRGKGIWTLHFYAWWWDESYQIPLEHGEKMDYTPDELSLIQKHNLTAEQIKWRRFKISELGDFFMQEYPEDIETCFLVSGRGVFQLDKPNLFTPFTEDRSIIGFPVSVASDYVPDDKSVHVMGIDWGVQPDSSAVSIWDSTTYREIALYITGRRDYEYIVDDMIALAKHYNVKYIVPEKNSMRMQVSFLAKGLQVAMPDNTPRVTPFNMDNRRKDDLVKLIQQGMSDGLQLLDNPVARHELRIFEAQQTPTGLWTYGHPTGEHDDTVIARMLAHLACYQLRDRLTN